MRVGNFVATAKDTKVPVVIHIDENGTTTAVLEVYGLIGVGVARCNPIDYYNEDIGVSIATARAMKKVVESVERMWVTRAQTKEFVATRRANKRVLKP